MSDCPCGHGIEDHGDYTCGAYMPPTIGGTGVCPCSAGVREVLAAAVEQARADERRFWMDWLVATGYGYDWHHRGQNPCTLQEMAEAYEREIGDGHSVEEWEWSLRHEVGCDWSTGIADPEAGEDR